MTRSFPKDKIKKLDPKELEEAHLRAHNAGISTCPRCFKLIPDGTSGIAKHKCEADFWGCAICHKEWKSWGFNSIQVWGKRICFPCGYMIAKLLKEHEKKK